ncbi:uncharacterized protein LOC100178015 isoform X1 [Ciona intestinalis]
MEEKSKNLASADHRRIYKELKDSETNLLELYKQSRDATFKFKSSFNEVRKVENETELLRQRYYQMLEKECFSEVHRDAYFNNEKLLADIKDMYISDSQKLAHGHSMYIAYNNNYSEKREEYIHSMLEDVDKYYASCHMFKAERDEFKAEAAKLTNEVEKATETISTLIEKKEKLLETSNNLRKECDERLQWGTELRNERDKLLSIEEQMRQNIEGLQSSISDMKNEIGHFKERTHNLTTEVDSCRVEEKRLKYDIVRRQKEQTELRKSIEEYEIRTAELTKQKNDYISRVNELTKEVESCQLKMEKVEEQRDLFKEAFKQVKKEKDEIHQNCEKLKKEKEKFKDQYMEMQNERVLVGKAKDKILSRQFRTAERNQDLSEAHKYLIKELDELRTSFRKAEERARKDLNIKQDLRDTIKRMQREREEEIRKLQKVTKDVRIQTDPDLACENRDIAIQHAKFKMNQALQERDRALKESLKVISEKERLILEMDKKTKLLEKARKAEVGHLEKIGKSELKVKSAEKLYRAAKKEAERSQTRAVADRKLLKAASDKLKALHEEKKEDEIKLVGCCSTQTVDVIILNEDEGDTVYAHAKAMREKLDQSGQEIQSLKKEIENAEKVKTNFLKEIDQLKRAVCFLSKKSKYIEQSFNNERSYLKSIKRAATPSLKDRDVLPYAVDRVNEWSYNQGNLPIQSPPQSSRQSSWKRSSLSLRDQRPHSAFGKTDGFSEYASNAMANIRSLSAVPTPLGLTT